MAANGIDEADRLGRFAMLLRESPHNLLSPRALEELESRHFPESLHFARSLPPGPRLLDIGSGGGLPGIVIAIARPDLAVELLDATRKKADFLRTATAELGLDVVVHHGRAEDLVATGLRGAFDLVTARAVAPLERLVPWAAPFLARGGTLHAIKGDRWAEELAAAHQAVAASGLEVVRSPELTAGRSRRTLEPTVVVLRRPG